MDKNSNPSLKIFSRRFLGYSKTFSIWIIGFNLAFVFATGASFLFNNSLEPYVWEPAIQHRIYKPGLKHRNRREGWATTLLGEYGIHGVPNIKSSPNPKIAIWGKSFVEGFTLNDDEKIAQQFTKLWNSDHPSQPLLGCDLRAASLPAITYLLPKYASLASPIQYHFILIHDWSYVSFSDPEYDTLISPTTENRKLKILRDFQLDFIFSLYRKLKDQKLDFIPGPKNKKADSPSTNITPEVSKTWSKELKSIREKTEKPIIFLYAPSAPFLRDGKLIFRDPDEIWAREFEKQCKLQKIGFLNLEKAFSDFYKKTKIFPRGFLNSHPYQGHFNKYGAEIVANTMKAYIEK